MKRVIRIRSEDCTDIEIIATIHSNGSCLTRDEVENIRDRLADSLMGTLTNLPYSAHRLSKMKVSG